MSNKRLNLNRLMFEKSPYLLQHADNPVDWYPWIPEAFEKARNEHKPIFLSIGYSTCHWCHVMEKESFKDLDVANLLNKAFICIKVDREERPDIDNIYMSICQMMTGQGGWPLTIIMTPDQRPFYAATYLPKESRYGRIGMKKLISYIIKLWKNNRSQIMNIAEQVTSNLNTLDQFSPKDLDKEVFNATFEHLLRTFDEQYGGFGDAPKFPIPHNLMFLLRYWKRSSNEKALSMVEKTLKAIMQGGICDHLGFGFHRYSTDSQWIIPHFEKMLYDQALLAIIYTETYQITKKKDYKDVVHDIFTYVLRDLYHPNGGFYSAEDADSEGEEGKFYLWSQDQIERVLTSEETKYLIQIYNIKKEGNYRSETNKKLEKHNILYLKKPISKLANELGIPEQNLRKILRNAKKKLFTIRRERVPPLKDEKILTDWNGLILVALAKGAKIFSNKKYINAAAKTVDFIMKYLVNSNGRLSHRYYKGDTSIPAFLDDYAFLIWGLLELYETTFETSYLQTALSLTKDMITHFWDNQHTCFFLTADDVDTPLTRTKKIYDGAIPSGNSVAMLDLLLLSRITANPQLEEKAISIGRALSDHILKSPLSFTQLLLALDFLIGPTYELIFVGKKNSNDLQIQLKKLRESFIPNKILLFRSSSESNPEITKIAPFTQNLKSINGKSTIYVCKNHTCTLPTTDIKNIFAQLN